MAEEIPVTYEELSQLEYEFDDVELEILRKQYLLSQPLYVKRHSLVAKIDNFWPLVFEQVPPEIDQYIQPSDSQIFAECLKSLEVERFDIENSPRSFTLRFGFSANEYFEDEVLEKKFNFRRAVDNWTGLVSEPVKVHWKKGKDITGGLTDAAFKLWESNKTKGGTSNGTGKEKKMSDHDKLANMLENSPPSFFVFFGFISERRYVTEEESAKASIAEAERRKKKAAGEKVEDVEQEDDESNHHEVEICPFGDDLANMIAEDVWPNASKYFTSAQEMDDEELSEMDFEEDEESDDEIDIRSLVQGKRKQTDRTKGDTPPAKSRKATD